jgi:molybdopterin molybdotransferase
MKNRNRTVSIEEAQEIILNSVTPLEGENVSIMRASGRVLHEDIVSDVMVPPLDDSAMDGYAVFSEDTYGASRENPVRLPVMGEIQAGDPGVIKEASKGTAIRIMTGAPIPKGADSVVQFEDTEEENGHVNIFHEAKKHENYRFAGENIKRGDCVLQRGDRLNSADVGILASLNYGTVKVYRQPTVSIISTGDELADIGEEIQVGQFIACGND